MSNKKCVRALTGSPGALNGFNRPVNRCLGLRVFCGNSSVGSSGVASLTGAVDQRVILTGVKKSARVVRVRNPDSEQPASPFWRLVYKNRVFLDVRIHLEDRSVDWHYDDSGTLNGLDCRSLVSLANMSPRRR
jgi:hypothetical protein